METNITVQVHVIDLARSPSRIANEKNKYRIYVNDHLLTERDWIWSVDTYIEENIRVDINPTDVNHITLEPIYRNKSMAKFALRNLKVNGEPKAISDDGALRLSF